MNQCLLVDSVSKSFPLTKKQAAERHVEGRRLVAVDKVSFSVNRGEIYALLGPNGAGKTTTLRMISSLISPDEGSIHVDGEKMSKENDALRTKIGFLTSELKLDPFFSPNYTFAFLSELYGVDKKTMEERRERIFKRFGIDSFSEAKIKNLSTGMKQKCSLAMSLVADPDLIVYDEPTNGLDIVATRDVEDFLMEEREAGKAIVISTHIISIVEKLSDRVGIMLHGRMFLEDDVKNLKEKHGSVEEAFFSLVKEEGK